MEKEILQVRMLGGFSMVYQEKTLVFDRNYISKSTQLLQILFLHLEKGIARSGFWKSCMVGMMWRTGTAA